MIYERYTNSPLQIITFMSTKLTNFRLDDEALDRLAEMNEATGIDNTKLVHLAIANLRDEIVVKGRIPIHKSPRNRTRKSPPPNRSEGFH